MCLPSQLACWGPLVIQEPHQDVLSCDRVLCHQQIWFFCWLCHCLGHWCRWGKAVGPEHCLVIHLLSLVSSCWRLGWCKPFGTVLLTSSGSIGLHYLGWHVPWPLWDAFQVEPCSTWKVLFEMPFESPGRWGPLLCCCPCSRCQWNGQRSQAGLLGRCVCFWSHVESHLSVCCPKGVWLSCH